MSVIVPHVFALFSNKNNNNNKKPLKYNWLDSIEFSPTKAKKKSQIFGLVPK